MKNYIIVILVLMLSAGTSVAQRVIKPKLIEVDWKGIIYKKEWSVDLRLHEEGGAIAYNSGTIKSYHKTNYYHLELGYTKDPREKTQTKISRLGRSGSFAFGKINSVINLRGGLGVKRYLSEKEKRKGLAVGYTYEIGPTVALLKPYYLDLIYVETIDERQVATVRSEKYSEENADKFLEEGSISDHSNFFRGFSELSARAGVQGKIGLHLDMGAYDKYVKAFETGVMFDLFTSKVPIMLETETAPHRRFFFKLYFNFQLGVRSN